MNKAAKIILALAVVAVMAVAAIMVNDRQAKEKDSSNSSNNSSQATGQEADAAVTITYDGSSFTSSADTIMAGQKVKVVNSSSQPLDFDSDPHPVHTDNEELNAGDIEPGASKTFTITKKGSWGYHNHLNAGQKGEITVQ